MVVKTVMRLASSFEWISVFNIFCIAQFLHMYIRLICSGTVRFKGFKLKGMQMDIRSRKKDISCSPFKHTDQPEVTLLSTSSMTSSSPVSVWTPQQWHPQWRRHPPDCYCVSYGVDWFFFKRGRSVMDWHNVVYYNGICYFASLPIF